MKKIKTLKLNYEFKNVFNKGKYYIGKQVIIYLLKNKYNYNRLGIAINTKLCGAVQRNRIKRVIRSAYQKNNISNFKINDKLENNYDIVFIWNKKSKIEDLSYNIIENDIKNILKLK